ncbi:tRNA pseudouridine(55) synthase TruB [Sphingobacterium gobiense]|uniref:tRNA pseudouridine synthase B n=1 Tax=Sphingobacterium gobiense TaxID=1382456 RepID=A0A2S9JSX9_9SPHI|nr:tRNA pseudouridine(55) synthase TruB [Sphingobacterium gobiense]PRD56379.1 tRNA pseudouridine(55) synthase TruB [Sphingobacterium gobiense]
MTKAEETVSSPFDFAAGEVLLVDKPLEWTSFDVVGKLRNSMKPQKIKVGHAGTLDPLATGLLIICTGKFTKRIDSFQAEDKEYTGVITLGATTPSYDLETAVDQTFDYTHLNDADIHKTTLQFLGVIEQYPPAHSAIKIKGERVYEKARRGEEVELKARRITINSFEIEKIEMPNVHFRIGCSKGTYIRSIAHDFGKALGIGAHLSQLRRTKSGDFHVDDAWNLQNLIEKIKLHRTTIQQQ